jgi:predicted GIY-YIG superfamily endonuclease
MAKQLVYEYLEKISRKALKDYQAIIREYVGRKKGIYALYRKDKLYYIGLATNLRLRLSSHLRGKHADTWDRFSVYLTKTDQHLKELESLILRITLPKGNKQKGKFSRAENLKKKFKRQGYELKKAEIDDLLGDNKPSVEKFKRRIVAEGREPVMKPYVTRRFRMRFDYKGKRYVASVRKNGKIYFKGKVFNSPSLAASYITKKPNNGWKFWKFQKSPGEWVYIDELRK